MEQDKFQKGNWVKHEQGTQAMTVIAYASQESAQVKRVICRVNDEQGESQEREFKEEELVLLNQ